MPFQVHKLNKKLWNFVRVTFFEKFQRNSNSIENGKYYQKKKKTINIQSQGIPLIPNPNFEVMKA